MSRASLFSGSGNRFLILDCLKGSLPEEASQWARDLCQAEEWVDPRERIDGLMFVLPPEEGGDLKMVLYNADGSRPEVCGNGLRCLASWAYRSGFQHSTLAIESDAGVRRAQVESESNVHVHMGSVRVAEAPEVVRILGNDFQLLLANVGNPHAILLVDELVEAPVQQIGSALQVHERFPEGVNVSFARFGIDEVSVRVFERGVGETLACGSAACAVAESFRIHGGSRLPMRIRMSGGVLTVHADSESGVWLSGSVREHAIGASVHARLQAHEILV